MYQPGTFSATPPEALIERLVAAGVRHVAAATAVNLIRRGAADLLQQVLDRELDPERAWRIARSRR